MQDVVLYDLYGAFGDLHFFYDFGVFHLHYFLMTALVGLIFFAALQLIGHMGKKQSASWQFKAMKVNLLLFLLPVVPLLHGFLNFISIVFNVNLSFLAKGLTQGKLAFEKELLAKEFASFVEVESAVGLPVSDFYANSGSAEVVANGGSGFTNIVTAWENFLSQYVFFGEIFMPILFFGVFACVVWYGYCYCRFGMKKREKVEISSDDFHFEVKLPVYLEPSLVSPVVVGVFRPKILLPHNEYKPEDLGFVLQHEMTHFRRKDLWWKSLLLWTKILYWYNPLLILFARKFEEVLELSCDEVVATELDFQGRKAYGASVLSAMMDASEGKSQEKCFLKRDETPLGLGFVKDKKSLKHRLEWLLRFDEEGWKCSKAVTALVSVVLLLGVTTVSATDIIGQYGLIFVGSGSTQSGDYVGSSSINFQHSFEFLNEEGMTEDFFSFQDDMDRWKDEIKGATEAPRYIERYMENDGSETVVTYAGFYTDDNGLIQEYFEERRYDIGVSVLFDRVNPYVGTPTVGMVFPDGIPENELTEEEARKESLALALRKAFRGHEAIYYTYVSWRDEIYLEEGDLPQYRILFYLYESGHKEMALDGSEMLADAVAVIEEIGKDYPEFDFGFIDGIGIVDGAYLWNDLYGEVFEEYRKD